MLKNRHSCLDGVANSRFLNLYRCRWGKVVNNIVRFSITSLNCFANIFLPAFLKFFYHFIRYGTTKIKAKQCSRWRWLLNSFFYINKFSKWKQLEFYEKTLKWPAQISKTFLLHLKKFKKIWIINNIALVTSRIICCVNRPLLPIQLTKNLIQRNME